MDGKVRPEDGECKTKYLEGVVIGDIREYTPRWSSDFLAPRSP